MAGFQPVSLVNMELQDGICDVGGDEVIRRAEQAVRPRTEALVLSCTNLPTLHLLAPLERRLGIPVLSANQVTMWAALRMAGARTAIEGQILFERSRSGHARGATMRRRIGHRPRVRRTTVSRGLRETVPVREPAQ